jgi:hypothetical protein
MIVVEFIGCLLLEILPDVFFGAVEMICNAATQRRKEG